MRLTPNSRPLVFAVIVAGLLAVVETRAADSTRERPLAAWSFDGIEGKQVADTSENGHHGGILGDPKPADGVTGQSLRLDGQQDYVRVDDAPALSFSDATFSVTAWVNVYAIDRGQQMIVAKNVYSADQREWGLMVDQDNRFRFYLHHGGWTTLDAKTEPKPGQWYHVAVTVDAGRGRFYVDGRLEAEGELGPSIPDTKAPLTIGGVDDGGRLRQMWFGALDDVRLHAHVVAPEQIAKIADRRPKPHEVPEPIVPYALWKGGVMPKTAEIDVLDDVEFSVIKPREPELDGGRWLLGVALAWHKGKLYASYGFNTGSENTSTEEAHVRRSDDAGKTWGPVVAIDRGEGNLGVSHGVFLSRGDELWAFQGAFFDRFQRTHTRAYVLDASTGRWQPKGVVVDQGFWPMQEPQRMDDGNWIMGGARVAYGYTGLGDHLPAVAISHGDDLTKWDLVVIPTRPGVSGVWGESTVIVDGRRIVNVSRWGGQAMALAAVSEDYGRTWTPSGPSNLPMATSKPYTGTLSTGQNYLVCTTTADSGGRRSPLTIAVSRPGEEAFSRVFVIRHAVFPQGPGPSHADARLCYPYAVERDGKLYVGYAAKNYQTAELAVAPVAALAVPEPVTLWDGGDLPKAADIPVLDGVEFQVIKPYEFAKDGYRFLHGVALAWHEDRLYASFGHNQGGENTDTEEARGRYSDDGGRTWSDPFTIDSGEPGLGVSHGVFLSHGGKLWAFHGAYHGTMQNVHARAYVLDQPDGTWEPKGVIVRGGFWPLQEPQPMDDGNWVMGGASIGNGNPAAVAISHGDDFTKWDLVVIPKAPGPMWGESSVIVLGKRLLNVARYHGRSQTVALVAVSEDYGRTWTRSAPSNLPMAASKPCTGTLSTGQHYLICTTTADSGNRRSPLTIAWTRPGEQRFSNVAVIRHARFDEGPGESHDAAALAYPYATEHDGKLYVGYSNNGGNVGRVGEGRQLWNNNSAEMAVIPIDRFRTGDSTE